MTYLTILIDIQNNKIENYFYKPILYFLKYFFLKITQLNLTYVIMDDTCEFIKRNKSTLRTIFLIIFVLNKCFQYKRWFK